MEVESELEVVLEGAYTTAADREQAAAVPKEELPLLGQAQVRVARSFSISLEEYARSLVAMDLGMRRREARARQLGRILKQIAREIDPSFAITHVIDNASSGRYLVRVCKGEMEVQRAFPKELGEEILNSPDRGRLPELAAILEETISRMKAKLKES